LPRSTSKSAVGTPRVTPSASAIRSDEEEQVDVVVIGSGLGGLSCAALLATSGLQVAVLEAHYEIGGCAHEWSVGLDGKPVPSDQIEALKASGKPLPPLFKFEAGPSLYSGLSPQSSPNPLKHVFQMIGEEPEWITYDLWGAHLPEAPDGYELSIGAENFKEILRRYGGPSALADWEKLSAELRPLSKGVMGIPSTAVRGDWGLLLTLAAKYPRALCQVLLDAPKIIAPFDLKALGVTDPFLANYLDLLAFLLQGLPASETLTAVMAYMVEDFYRPGAVMEFPKGGSGEIAKALARGVTKNPGCTVRVRSPVKRVLVEGNRAAGVELAKGRVIRARNAVVSNCDLYNTLKLVPPGASEAFDEEREKLGPKDESAAVPLCKSFMHLHLAVRADKIASYLESIPPQWTVVSDWDGPIDAPGKVVVVSMPTLMDPTLAPEGYHVIHAYAAGNEPYEVWETFATSDESSGVLGESVSYRQDPAYLELKAERSECLWKAIERRLPNIRDDGVCSLVQIGTPLTHARFLRRHRGNYGLAIAAGNKEGLAFPAVTTPLEGYFRCGDSTTAGIGVPAVASSGAQCANALLSVWDQLKLNEKIDM